MPVETGRERAIYASDPAQSRGRRFGEPASPTRNAFAATATGLSIRPHSGGWPTRRRSSSITKATTTARVSPIRSKLRRSLARLRAHLAWTKTSPKRWRSLTISAIRRLDTPANVHSTNASPAAGASITTHKRCAS